MLITIGVGIITFGIGMFVGKMLKSSKLESLESKSLFQTFIANLKAKIAQKKLEKAERTKMMNESRIAALKELQPEMIALLKEQELKKMTGQDKKDKLKKLADAFSPSGSGMGATNKLNTMLGNPQPIQQQFQQPIQQQQPKPPMQQQQQQPPQQQQMNKPGFDVGEKLKRMLR